MELSIAIKLHFIKSSVSLKVRDSNFVANFIQINLYLNLDYKRI